MPKSMFRVVEPPKMPDRHERFMKLIDALMQRLEDVPRMDIRDYIAACGVIDRALAREKGDDPDAAGSAVRKYAPNFQKTASAGAGRANPGAAAEPEPDRAADAGEPEPAEADDPGDDAG